MESSLFFITSYLEKNYLNNISFKWRSLYVVIARNAKDMLTHMVHFIAKDGMIIGPLCFGALQILFSMIYYYHYLRTVRSQSPNR